jgi:transposase
VERRDTIPGVAVQTALLIVAEIGVEMERFPTAKHLSAWAGMAPGNNERGGRCFLSPSWTIPRRMS